MTTLRRTSMRAEIRQWWIAVNAHHDLFFRLIQLDSFVHTNFINLDTVLHRLEQDVYRFIDMPYPESAASIRSHLKHAMEHAADSLWCLKHGQHFECDVRFNIAQVDMTMLYHELEELHIL